MEETNKIWQEHTERLKAATRALDAVTVQAKRETDKRLARLRAAFGNPESA